MCGILGYFSSKDKPYNSLEKSLDYMHKRGPDAKGIWEDENVYLGHRRLSIIDLDERSNQPLESYCGRYIIVFNGEIYNFKDLKKLVPKYKFKTRSDTEVILALFSKYKEKMLNKLKGMFSFIIWDKVDKVSFIARDPYGIKPLYYSKINEGIIFSSQVSSIMASGLVSFKKCKNGLEGFNMLGSVPEPYTWYNSVKAVKAGNYMLVKNNQIIVEKLWFDIQEIWNLSYKNHQNFVKKDFLKSKIRTHILESISRHLISDVPVGIFLSGGIDSGVIAALMAETGMNNIIGVTISYDEFIGKKKDESLRAKVLAKKFGIKHHIRKVTKDEFINDLPTIIRDMDQPSIDGINTWYASKAASELGLKVVVSGVGGDELFYGYHIFNELPYLVRIFQKLSKLPFYDIIFDFISKKISERKNNNRWKYLGRWLVNIEGAWWLRRSINSPTISKKKFNIFNPKLYLQKLNVKTIKNEMKLSLAIIESKMYLKNQLLRDSDWASMSHSLELRTPLVDVHLLNNLKNYLFILSKYRNKEILSNCLKTELPKEVYETDKTGFGIPIKEWLDIDEKINNQIFHTKWTNKIVNMYNNKFLN